MHVIHSHEFTMSVSGTAASLPTRRPHGITIHGSETMRRSLRQRGALRWAFCASRTSVACFSSAEETLARDFELRAGRLGVDLNGSRCLAGRVIVAPARSGIPEAIVPEEHGLLVPRRDSNALVTALRRVLESSETRNRPATSATARADREFTVAARADRHEVMYYG